MSSIIRCNKLFKEYEESASKSGPVTQVLKGLDLDIEQGERVAILGQSGSGKSTLLHLLGMLDEPTSGELMIAEQPSHSLNELQRAQFRNENMGFIYQFHHLLMEFSALENVAMPLLINGVARKDALEQAQTLLDEVGLSHRLEHLPSQLSGGERQRVAIARALVNKPKLVLADEPTGNLDKQNADQVFELFVRLNQTMGTTLIVVTHDTELAKRFQRVIKIEDGKVAS